MNIIQCPYYITLYNHMGQIAEINIPTSFHKIVHTKKLPTGLAGGSSLRL